MFFTGIYLFLSFAAFVSILSLPDIRIMAPSSKGKSQAEHVNTFNSLVSAYKVKPTDKMLSELEKVVVVLSKVSDLTVFDPKQKEGLNMLLHSQYLISTLESRNSTLWSIVSLLSSITTASNNLANFLANSLCVVPTLARLLHEGRISEI